MNYPYGNQNNQGQFAAASSRPQLSLGDWLSLLGREIWLMAAVFSIVALLGIAFSFTFKKKYDAEARISVLIGQEYVYSPTVGEVGQGQTPKQEEIVQSEIEILTSAQVRANALKAIGLDRVYDPKDLVVSSGPDTPEQKFNVGVDAMREDFSSFSTPNTTVIKLGFTNKDPQVAADTLNKLIEEYLVYRRKVLFEDRSQGLGGQAAEFAKELDNVQAQINNFLVENHMSDYEAERTANQNLLATTRQELMATISRRTEAQGRFSSTNAYYSKEPSEVRLSFESDNSKRLIELQQQLAELLTKYTEQSQPVQDMRRRIDALENVINSPQGKNSGNVKIGPNPVRDSLATDRARNNAEVVASQDREKILQEQVNQLEARAMQIAQIRPQYEELMRKKAVLEEQVKQFSTRELAASAQSKLNAMSNDNIRVIEHAVVPTKGSSLKKFVAMGAILFGLFCGLVAGLIRVLSRSSFPTSKSVGRSLGIPVLATINR